MFLNIEKFVDAHNRSSPVSLPNDGVCSRFYTDKDLGPSLQFGQLAAEVLLDGFTCRVDLEDRLELGRQNLVNRLEEEFRIPLVDLQSFLEQLMEKCTV
jgi:hypothetical protein